MPKPRRTRPATAPKSRPLRRDPRVLVRLITEPKRPLVGTDRRFRGNLHRPVDWHTFGFDECQAEMKRRKAMGAVNCRWLQPTVAARTTERALAQIAVQPLG